MTSLRRKDYRNHPTPEYRFFLYDPNDGATFWKTEEERDEAAKVAIDSYLDEEWDEDVSYVIAGVVTHGVIEIDRADKIGEPDDDGYLDYKCNYALKPLDTTSPSHETR